MFRYLFNLLLLLSLLAGCQTTQEVRTDPGTGHSFREGYPEVKSRVTSFFNDSLQPVIELNLEVPYNSLIFRTIDGERTADIQVQVVIRKNDESAEVIQRFTEEFRVVPSRSANRLALLVNESFVVVPGDYRVNVNVRDKTSGKVTPVQLTVSVPDPEVEPASLSDIRVLVTGREDGENIPVSAFVIPARGDSLTFEFFVSRSDIEVIADVELKLKKINSDTSAARPIGGLPLNIGSLQYRGIDYSDMTTVTSQSRRLESELGSILVEFSVPMPVRGNYRFEVNLNTSDNTEESHNYDKFRDFLIVSPNFPKVQTLHELVRPMEYLMTPREFRNLMSHENPDSLRREFDRFWLNNIRDRSTARDVIELYFSRVEEANRLFSNFKEGWKTDMGMVYILMGPPINIENTIDGLIWYYSYSRIDPTTVLRFDRARVSGSSFPFMHYILLRQRFYQSLEQEVINDWLSGDVLTRRR